MTKKLDLDAKEPVVPKKEIETFITDLNTKLDVVFTNINNRITAIEQKQNQPIELPIIKPQEQPLTTQQQNKLSDLLQFLPLLQGERTEVNTMDQFFKELGERAFYNVFDKILPSRKDLKEGLK